MAVLTDTLIDLLAALQCRIVPIANEPGMIDSLLKLRQREGNERSWRLQFLGAERAARAVGLLRPRIAIPIHWGTLAPMGRAPDVESPLEFARLAGGISVDVSIVEPGMSLSV